MHINKVKEQPAMLGKIFINFENFIAESFILLPLCIILFSIIIFVGSKFPTKASCTSVLLSYMGMVYKKCGNYENLFDLCMNPNGSSMKPPSFMQVPMQT